MAGFIDRNVEARFDVLGETWAGNEKDVYGEGKITEPGLENEQLVDIYIIYTILVSGCEKGRGVWNVYAIRSQTDSQSTQAKANHQCVISIQK